MSLTPDLDPLRELQQLMADRQAALSAFNATTGDENDVAGCVLTVTEKRASEFVRSVRNEAPPGPDAPVTWAGRLQELLNCRKAATNGETACAEAASAG
ncbi:MAG: hypothetical protein RDU89_06845 [bacterium]|nr:hypothetical protein [bacterium]